MAEAVRFDDILRFRCPSDLRERMETVAAAKLMKPAEYARRAIVDRLEADGVDPLTVARAE